MSIPPINSDALDTWGNVGEDVARLTSTPVEKPSRKKKIDPFFSGTVYKITGWRLWFLLFPASLLVKLYYATLRVKMSPEDEAVLRNTPEPMVGMAWHNHSLIVPMLIRRFRNPAKCYCLISPSKAAAWEDSMFKLLGIPSARGSSSRRSIIAMCELIHGYDKGFNIYISPDGPVGPRFKFKRGAVAAARMTKAPILLVGARCPSAWRPDTWDRHIVPLPFAKIHLKIKVLANAEVFDGHRDDGEVCERLTEELMELTGERE